MATPSPSLSPAPSVSVAPSPFLPTGGSCAVYSRNDVTLDIAAGSSVVLGKGINMGYGRVLYGWARLFANGLRIDLGRHQRQNYRCPLAVSCSPTFEDTLFESNITGGNIIGGSWPGDEDEDGNDYWGTRGPSMELGTYDQVNLFQGPVLYALGVKVNIFGANFVGNWDLWPTSEINVYGYGLELSEDNEMPCPRWETMWLPTGTDTTTCKVLTGYLCDDSPINVKVRFPSAVAQNYVAFDVNGTVNLFNNVDCKTVVPKIDGCGMQKCVKSKSDKQVPEHTLKSSNPGGSNSNVEGSNLASKSGKQEIERKRKRQKKWG